MREVNPNKVLLDKILRHIPIHIKPVNYLMDILKLSKDSVYRRLKLEVSFTYEEAVVLAEDLNFSLNHEDDSDNTGYIRLNIRKINTVPDAIQSFEDELKYISDRIIQLNNSKYAEIIITKNRAHILPVEYHETLFRFFYFKWLHLLNVVPMDYTFGETAVPSNIVEYAKNQELIHNIENVTFIVDSNEFLNTIQEIQYFYRQGLIEAKDIQLLKADLIEKITYEPRRLLKNTSHSTKYVKCYLSDFNLSTNTMYTRDEYSEESLFWLYSIIPQHTACKEICSYHRMWIEDFKRYSTLITGSGGIVLSRYISEQMEHVKNMDKIMC